MHCRIMMHPKGRVELRRIAGGADKIDRADRYLCTGQIRSSAPLEIGEIVQFLGLVMGCLSKT